MAEAAHNPTRFVELAVTLGLLPKDQGRAALLEQKELLERGEKRKIGEILVQKGWLTPGQVADVLAEQVKRRGGAQAPQRPGRATGGAIPKRIGVYEIEAALGQGGMGAVYRARDPQMNRTVALKVLNQSMGFNEGFLKRFEREVKAAGALSHPNIVAAYGAGEEGGRPFLVMELVEGETLRDRLKRDGPFPERQALALIRDLAAGLAHAHTQGLVHRDVKPANVLLARDGRIKLADMGLAKSFMEDENLTKTGVAVGTPSYMSPEQARGDKQIDHRSDIYSLGAMLYELLTGQPPFAGGGRMQIMMAHVNKELTPPRKLNPALSDGANRLVVKLMEKHPDDRFDCCEDLIEALERALQGKGAPAAASPGPAAGPSLPGPDRGAGRVPTAPSQGEGRQTKVKKRGKGGRGERSKNQGAGCLLAFMACLGLGLLAVATLWPPWA